MLDEVIQRQQLLPEVVARCFLERQKPQSKKQEREGKRGRESHEEVCTAQRKKFVNYDSVHYEHYNAHYDRPIEQSKHLHFLLPGLAGLTKAPSQTNKPNEKKRRRKANKELTLGNISLFFFISFKLWLVSLPGFLNLWHASLYAVAQNQCQNEPSRAEPSWSRDSKLGLSHSKRSHVAAMVNSWPSTEPIVAPLNNYTSTTRLAEEEPSWRGRG